MTKIYVEHFANPKHVRCDHRRCDGRRATWRVLGSETATAYLSCSVHLPRFCEIRSAQTERRSTTPAAAIVTPLSDSSTEPCCHPRCDGRRARWALPQTANAIAEPRMCCSVHLARLVEITLAYHVSVAA